MSGTATATSMTITAGASEDMRRMAGIIARERNLDLVTIPSNSETEHTMSDDTTTKPADDTTTGQTDDVNTDANDDDDDDATEAPASQLVFSSFGKVTINDNSQVTVPADRARDFGNAATYFSAHSNRHTLTVDLGSTDAAKLFAKQVNSYANSHGLSTSPKRDESRVTFRFASKRDASKVDTKSVTVTEATPAKLPEPIKPAGVKAVTPASIKSKSAK